MADVMRVETEHGEATLIISRGVVEHASPAMVWALGMRLETLKQRIAEQELAAVWVRFWQPSRKGWPNGRWLDAV